MTSDQLKCLGSLTVFESLTLFESLTVSDSLLQFGPELVLVSAGFDAALGDPLVCELVVTGTASCVNWEETIMSDSFRIKHFFLQKREIVRHFIVEQF